MRYANLGVAVSLSLTLAACTEDGGHEDGAAVGSEGSSSADVSSSSEGPGPATEGSTSGEGESSEGDSSEAESSVATCEATSLNDVVFAETSADPALTSLDVLADGEGAARPIVIWVHGGGWVEGDKASHTMNPAFASFFAERGELLVSINYRLVNDPANPGITFAEQAADVAAAIAWVVEHAEELCGDPDRVHLVGYSAGAHLVALVAADPDYLAAHELHPEMLASVVSLDVNAYDIPWAIDNALLHDYPAAINALPAVFGRDLESQLAASPMEHIQAGAVPPSLVISAPDQSGVIQSLSRAASERYVDALVEADNEAEYFEAIDDSHASLASDFGSPGDAVTEVVAAFLDAH